MIKYFEFKIFKTPKYDYLYKERNSTGNLKGRGLRW